jgi:hypothetical protein
MTDEKLFHVVIVLVTAFLPEVVLKIGIVEAMRKRES